MGCHELGITSLKFPTSQMQAAGEEPGASKHDIEHSKWYNKVHKIVLSRTLKDAVLPKATIISNTLPDRINKIIKEAGSEILLFGSPTATHSLMQPNLIDRYWLFVNPIILGRGITLFFDVKDKIKLLTNKQFTYGVTELNYTADK